MADNIGLFGLTPEQVMAQQMAARNTQAANFASMTPEQKAAYMMYQGGAGLGDIAAGMFGARNPQVEQARAQQQALQGADLQTPEGLRAVAQRLNQLGMTQQAYAAASKANELDALRQETALKRAKELVELKKLQEEAKTKMPTSIEEYNFAKSQGYTGTYEQWVKDKVKSTDVTVNIPAQEKGFETELGKGQAEALLKGRAAADDAVEIINTVQEGRNILNKGMVTGFGANFIVGVGQALKQAGIDFGGDATSNAQAYTANMAQNVGKLIKQFGAGTGLSDADRQYANKMAGGEISIDEKAIRKILDINEKAARNIIRLQNKRASGIKTNIPLTVEEPPMVNQGWSIRKK